MDNQERKLTPNISPLAAWACALGTSIGWGSFVITSNTYLLSAGPMGSSLGMLIGGLIMLVIGFNYHYMVNCFPEAGGVYAYCRETFGHDHGFLTAWFLALTYMAVLWANATSLPLFTRYFIGDIFRFGKLYTVFGYEVYLGEALLSIVFLAVTAFFLSNSRRGASLLLTGMVLFFTVGIILCFAAAIIGLDRPMDPSFIPDRSAAAQVLKIACISPWAFIGFENISHLAEEFDFPHRRTFRILAAAIIATTMLYIFIFLLSVTAYPPAYPDWLSYIRDLGNLSGIEALPAFYAAGHYLGPAGIYILIFSLLCLVLTSLIGNTLALSRLFYSLACDRILPERFAALSSKDTPANAVLLATGIAMIMPFAGRTAIGWIVDVTTIGATMVYGFVSAAAWKTGEKCEDNFEASMGLAGLVLMIGFAIYLLVPNLFSTGSIEPESYFLFVVWSVLGIFYFRRVLTRDEDKRFGQSIVVWIALLSLILFVSLVWMSQSSMNAAEQTIARVQEFYHGANSSISEEALIASELSAFRRTNSTSIAVVVCLFAMSLGFLIINYSTMSRRARESESALGHMQNIASKDPLTGVKSKHAYAEKTKEVDQMLADGTQGPFSIVVCDVNGLKMINDTLGHKAGDAYICAAAELICHVFKHSPVYRVGGDEFVVYLAGHDYDGREELMDLINQKVEANIGAGEVVVSCGLSDYDAPQDKTWHDVFERADQLMYARKKQLKSMGAPTR